LRELQVVDDVRPQERQRVGKGREPEARMEFLGDGRAADERPALQDERAKTTLREVGAVREAVVSATDDDGVVGPIGRHRQAVLRSGSYSGVRVTTASKYSYLWLTASSSFTRQPGRAYSSGPRARAMCRWSIDEYI